MASDSVEADPDLFAKSQPIRREGAFASVAGRRLNPGLELQIQDLDDVEQQRDFIQNAVHALGIVGPGEDRAAFEEIAPDFDGDQQALAIEGEPRVAAAEMPVQLLQPFHEGRGQEIARLDLIGTVDLEHVFKAWVLQMHLVAGRAEVLEPVEDLAPVGLDDGPARKRLH